MPDKQNTFNKGWDDGTKRTQYRFNIWNSLTVFMMFFVFLYKEVRFMLGFKFAAMKQFVFGDSSMGRIEVVMLLWLLCMGLFLAWGYNIDKTSNDNGSNIAAAIPTTSPIPFVVPTVVPELNVSDIAVDLNLAKVDEVVVEVFTMPLVSNVEPVKAIDDNCTDCVADFVKKPEISNKVIEDVKPGYSKGNMNSIFKAVTDRYTK